LRQKRLPASQTPLKSATHDSALSSVVEHYLDTAFQYKGHWEFTLLLGLKKALDGYRNRRFATLVCYSDSSGSKASKDWLSCLSRIGGSKAVEILPRSGPRWRGDVSCRCRGQDAMLSLTRLKMPMAASSRRCGAVIRHRTEEQ
jgi:hypothetical protein